MGAALALRNERHSWQSAATTRGFTAEEFREIGELIAHAVFHAENEAALAGVRARTAELLERHPLYPELVMR